MKALKITGMVVAGLGFFALTIFLVSLILSLLWNWLMPILFGLPEISLLQAAGIFILSKLIFTPGFGRGHKSRKFYKRHDWKEKFKEKMRKSSGDIYADHSESDLESV